MVLQWQLTAVIIQEVWRQQNWNQGWRQERRRRQGDFLPSFIRTFGGLLGHCPPPSHLRCEGSPKSDFLVESQVGPLGAPVARPPQSAQFSPCSISHLQVLNTPIRSYIFGSTCKASDWPCMCKFLSTDLARSYFVQVHHDVHLSDDAIACMRLLIQIHLG